MQKRSRAEHGGFILVALFIISSFSLCLGLSLCLVKSPAATSNYYITASDRYIQQAQNPELPPESITYLLDQSRMALSMALQADPYNALAWSALSLTLVKKNDVHHAMRARDVAGDLGLSDLPTIHALRSLLPARNLALFDLQNDTVITR